MARLKDRAKFIQATNTIVGESMQMQDLVFGAIDMQTGVQFQYDTRVVEGKTASFTSFSQSAEVVEKDGKATVTIDPFLINRSVTFDALDAEAEKFGETIYSEDGGYASDVMVVGQQCHLGALKRRKLLMSSVLAYGALTKARDGVNADFNIPATSRKTLSTKLWNVPATSTPIADLRAARGALKTKPSIVIMNANDWDLFIQGSDVVSNNMDAGKRPQNVRFFEDNNNQDGVIKVARVVDPLVNLDVYVWNENREDGTPYLPNGYICITNTRAGMTGFAGVYTRLAPNTQARYIATEWNIAEIRGENPTIDALEYKSAPIYIAKDNNAFYHLKAY